MGIVYLARERGGGREVAIKLLASAQVGDAEAAQRFAREARTVAALEHPRILRTLAIEQFADGGIAIVSEHVAGRTLRSVLREHGALPFEHAAALLRDVASALAHAHAFRVVHRDVKPENIFIEASSGRALLGDFGIARPVDSDTLITVAGASLGTPSYMAPEQVRGAPVDERADVYALGLVGWETMTGMRPWEGETLYDVLHKQQHEPLQSLAEVRPDMPAYLLAAIDGAIAKRPEERWPNAGRFLERLTPTPVAMPSRASDRSALADAATMPAVRAASPAEPPPAVDAPSPAVTAPAPGRGADIPVERVATPDVPVERLRAADIPVERVPAAAPTAAAAASSRRNSRPRVRIARGPLFALAAALIVGIGLVIFAQRRSGGNDGVWSADGRPATRADTSTVASGGASFEDTASGRLPARAAPPAAAGDSAATRREAAGRDSMRRVSSRADSVRRDALRRESLRSDSLRRASMRRDSIRVAAAVADSTARRVESARASAAPAASNDACATPTNAAQRTCLMSAIDRNDADLNRTYQSLIAALRREAGGTREPPAVRSLRVEQRAWLVQRDRTCQRTASTGGGALWAETRIPCFAEQSEEREAVLRERLRARTGRDSL